MTRDPTTESLVDTLADEFMRRYRGGERPTIAEYLERCPNLADQIRELFPALIMLENMATPGDGPQYSLLAGLKRPDVLGDYRILQETGRGGMGIVYEAEQISLGRHVAIKVLPFQLVSDQSAVDRFHREARAAARLQHPNIVPVYDFCQGDSVWYYAMQFIHGQSLEEVLSELQRLRETADGRSASGQLLDLATSLISNDTWNFGQVDDLEESAIDDSPRLDRIREVADAALQRIAQGESISEDDLYVEHPELMPELKEQFRMLQLIEASRPPMMVDELDELGHRMHEAAPPQEQGETFPAIPTSAQKLTGQHGNPARPGFHEYYKNVARLMLHVARALEYAHQEGVIHRDVKPSNLLLDTRGQIWITDFGLAKLSRGDVTSTGSFAGTLRYMAPEQIRGKVDPRTDVYSLGITLYEMLTLQPAFQGADYLGMMKQICEEGPVAPRDVDPAIPRDLETIVLRAIERDYDTRYPTARALADDLERFIEHREIRARRDQRYRRATQVFTLRSVAIAMLGVLLIGVLFWAIGSRRAPVVAANSKWAHVLAMTRIRSAIDDQQYPLAKSILQEHQEKDTFELGIFRRRVRPGAQVFGQLSIGNGPVTQLTLDRDRIFGRVDGNVVRFNRHEQRVERVGGDWATQLFHGSNGVGWFGLQDGLPTWAWESKEPSACLPIVCQRAVISLEGNWICTSDSDDRLQLWKLVPGTRTFEPTADELPRAKVFRFIQHRRGERPQLLIREKSQAIVVAAPSKTKRFEIAPRSICYGLWVNSDELLTAEDFQIRLRSSHQSGSPPIQVWTGRGPVRAIGVIRQDETIVAGLANGEVGLWQRATGKPLLVLDEAQEAIRSLAVSADEHLLVAGGQHGTVYWWDAAPVDD